MLCIHQVSVVSVLFIDNPVGTGYSYVTNDSAFTKDVYQIAQDLMTTITAFLQQLPDFQVAAHAVMLITSIVLDGWLEAYLMSPTLQERIHMHSIIYTMPGKKGATLFLPVTPRNGNRFSKFFHRHALQ